MSKNFSCEGLVLSDPACIVLVMDNTSTTTDPKAFATDLAAALTAAGVTHVKVSPYGTVFANQFGIFITPGGNVQARNVYDKDERFTLGQAQDAPDVLAAVFMEGEPG